MASTFAATAITRFDESHVDIRNPLAAVLLRSESASSSQIENLTSGARAIAEADINSKVAQTVTEATQPAVDNALAQLVERGILSPADSKLRDRLWINEEVIDALDAFSSRSIRR